MSQGALLLVYLFSFYVCGVLTCKDGYHMPITADGCVPCPIGTYSPEGRECYPCPAGLTTITEGTIGSVQCVKCAFGFLEVNGVCELCPKGSYYKLPYRYLRDLKGGDRHTVPVGECEKCWGEWTTRGPGGTECECGPGHYFIEKRYECIRCGIGRYSDVYFYNETCIPCPEHRTTLTDTASGLDQCVCVAGTFRLPDDDVCVTCPLGTYSLDGDTSCTPCPEGMTNRGPGGGSNLDSCVCLPGNFMNGLTGQCEPCRPQTYTPLLGGTICIWCPEGKTVSPDRTSCD